MLNKFFFITVDTEGDNLWSMPSVVTTQNALFLERFQRLCNRYGFYPIYLTNYEMEHDEAYVEFGRHYLQRELCEIGMHLHAWNMPPKFELIRGPKYHNAYLIEYPVEIMEEKIKLLTDELEDTFQTKIISHRAGRWATNRRYFELLEKYGYKVDCSVTPYVDWSRHVGYTEGSGGSDYRKSACGIGNAYEGGDQQCVWKFENDTPKVAQHAHNGRVQQLAVNEAAEHPVHKSHFVQEEICPPGLQDAAHHHDALPGKPLPAGQQIAGHDQADQQIIQEHQDLVHAGANAADNVGKIGHQRIVCPGIQL